MGDRFKTSKIFAKPDTWFDEGTEVYFESEVMWDFAESVIASGLRDGILDEELCPIEEFEIRFYCDKCGHKQVIVDNYREFVHKCGEQDE